jgi:long-subunit acyl-CoA synthetase (AMP-forming)
MWEQLTVYRPLDKKDINSTFKKFSQELTNQLTDFVVERTNSVIKLYRLRNNLEQGVFIEKHVSPDKLQIRVCIKPTDFYKTHKFTMVNIVPLGDIMGQYRKSFYPLTEEWRDLATYLSERIRHDVEKYFAKFDSYDKIIKLRKEIEPKDFGLDNKYELLIFAAIKTRNSELLALYIDKKLKRPTMQITRAEYLKADKDEIDEVEFLGKVKDFGQENKFDEIEEILKSVQKK